MLHVPIGAIKMRLEHTAEGHIVPVADIETPSDWLIPTSQSVHESHEAAGKRFIEECLKIASQYFRQQVTIRLAQCEAINPRVAQPVEQWSGSNVQ
jgi:hypothetical protein